jgi:hypothetical protein
MKILIIATPRCGGYTLHKELAKTYNLTAIHEPKWKGLDKEFRADSCVKTIVYDNTLEELTSLAAKFDKVILLDRKDKVAQTQAIVALNANKDDIKLKWEWKEGVHSSVDIIKWATTLTNSNHTLQTLSKELNVPLEYYEDIFYGNGLADKELEFKPDTSQKLRQINRKKSII